MALKQEELQRTEGTQQTDQGGESREEEKERTTDEARGKGKAERADLRGQAE